MAERGRHSGFVVTVASVVRLVTPDEFDDVVAGWDWIQCTFPQPPFRVLPGRDESPELILVIGNGEVVVSSRLQVECDDEFIDQVIQRRSEVVDDVAEDDGQRGRDKGHLNEADIPFAVSVDTQYGLGTVLKPVLGKHVEFLSVILCPPDLGFNPGNGDLGTRSAFPDHDLPSET
jgi:hypothetical protein